MPPAITVSTLEAAFHNYAYGLVGMAVILFIHGSCLFRIIAFFELHEERCRASKRYNLIFFNFYICFVLIACVHIIEITAWGIALSLTGLVDSYLQALLFAGSCYTTIGFLGDILADEWKGLAFFISFSGLFTLAWTTSAMVSMMAAHQNAWKLKYSEKLQHKK